MVRVLPAREYGRYSVGLFNFLATLWQLLCQMRRGEKMLMRMALRILNLHSIVAGDSPGDFGARLRRRMGNRKKKR